MRPAAAAFRAGPHFPAAGVLKSSLAMSSALIYEVVIANVFVVGVCMILLPVSTKSRNPTSAFCRAISGTERAV